MTPSPLIRRAPNVLFQSLAGDEGGVLLHLEAGEYHGLNPVGARIWELLASPRSQADLAEGLARDFKVPTATATADVETFLQRLSERNLIRWDRTA